MNNDTQPIIEIKNLKTFFGENCVHDDINLTIQRGEIFAIVGGSGSGKTTLLREMLLLMKPTKGSIKIFNTEVTDCSDAAAASIRKRWGVLFQQNALFGSLTSLENVAFPLEQHTELDKETINQIAMLKIILSGLPEEAANKYPLELSGGMQKRAALARAIALDPELLFLDEPTAGLDPESASALDELVLNLKSMLGLTVVMVTHDLDTLWRTADRIAFLGEGKLLGVGTLEELVKDPNPIIHNYFTGPRGRAAREATWKQK